MTDEPPIFTDKNPEARYIGMDLAGREEYSAAFWEGISPAQDFVWKHAMDPTPRHTARPNIVQLNLRTKFRCLTHGPTNHVFRESDQGVSCCLCWPEDAARAMEQNVRK